MRKLLIAFLILLPGCTSFNALQGGIADRGAAASDEALQSAEWVYCSAISVGAWRRKFGNDAEKAAAWRVLCSAPISETP